MLMSLDAVYLIIIIIMFEKTMFEKTNKQTNKRKSKQQYMYVV